MFAYALHNQRTYLNILKTILFQEIIRSPLFEMLILLGFIKMLNKMQLKFQTKCNTSL